MGESDDEDLETLRAAALQSLSVKAEAESQLPQPKWKAVGGRSGMGKPFQAVAGFRGRGPRKLYNRGRGGCYNGRGGVSMFGWAEAQQPISRSNLISIIPFNSEDNVPHPSSSAQTTVKPVHTQSQEEEDQSTVPTKFSRVERSDSESSEEEEKEEQDSEEEAEAEDPDVILMQDEDSLGKLLDEFEHELQEEQPGSKPVKKQVSPPKKKSTEVFRQRSPTPQRRRSPSPVTRNSPSLVRRRSPSPVRRRSPSPVRRRLPSPLRRRSPSPIRRRTPSPLRRRSPSPLRRRSPSPLRRRSPSPVRRRSPSPIRRRSPSPIHRRSLSPLRRRSHSPLRRISPFLTQQRSPSPKRRRSPSPLYRGSPGPPRRRSLSPKRRNRRSRSTSLEHQRHVFPPHVRKHFSPPSRHSLSRSPSPMRRRSPPRRTVYSRRSPTTEKRWRTPPTQYGSPRRGSRSPQHVSPRLVRKRSPGSPTRMKNQNLAPGEITRTKSPVRLRKLVVRRSISPNSRSSSNSSKSLSLSPPRSVETMRHVAPLVVKNPALRHTLGHDDDTNLKGGSPNKETIVTVTKVHKQKTSKTKVHPEVVEKNPTLEARRRKFESSAPIFVDNKKIRLSKKNSGLSSDITVAKSVASSATLSRNVPERTSQKETHIIKEEPQAAIKEDKKNDDLRAELRKRKAERLHQAGNVHHILPTRLVQSALHGVVGKGANLPRRSKVGTAAVALVTAVKDTTKKVEPKSEGRRVMVVSKNAEASEAQDMSNATSKSTTLDEGESSKGPVHTRLGNVASQRSRSRKSSKKVVVTTDGGSDTHHSHKKKEQRKFRLKRSKRHSSSPVPELKE